MPDATDEKQNASAIMDRCFAELAANAPAETVLPQLRAIEAHVQGDPLLKARFLRARAAATNRLGFGGEALGDLYEARRLLEPAGDARELSEVFRAVAVVFNWRGDGREAALALLRAVAEGSAAREETTVALSLVDAARLQMEIGRPGDAHALISRALDLAGPTLPRREYQRAWVTQLQAAVAARLTEEARAQASRISEALAGASQRLLLLAHIETARIERVARDHASARRELERSAGYAPADADAFERVEIAEAEAELAVSEGRVTTALELLDTVVSRYANDDLAAREVKARLLQAEALDALGREEEADSTLAAALRRALARDLPGFADAVRSRIASRGGAERVSNYPSGSTTVPITDAHPRFVRRRTLGSGGFGKVMRAYDLELGVEVALKRSYLKDLYDPAERDRLLGAARTEVAAASRMNHPGIARVFGLLSEEGGDALLVEELIEGPSLRQAMATEMSAARKFDLLSRIAFSLAAVHAVGVIHRDMKPDNVILRGGEAPVIVDFGIAMLGGGGDGATIGTAGYVAPEQARGRAVPPSDLYALGVVAYELLLETRPDPAPFVRPAMLAGFWRTRAMRRHLEAEDLDREAAVLVAALLSPHPRWRPSAAAAGHGFAEASGRASQRSG